jgi:hypothetical protein
MNAHTSVPETTGNGSGIEAHEHIPAWSQSGSRPPVIPM